MDYLPYIITPLICAVVGYSTNWLAIKMLFRPRREIRLAGIRLPFTPGLIPKERKRLAKKVAETVGKNVLTPEMLSKELTALAKSAGNFPIEEQIPKLIEWLRNALEENQALEEWLQDMVRKIIYEHVGRLAGIFLDSKKIYTSIKEGLFDYISNPANQKFLLTKAEQHLNIGKPSDETDSGLANALGFESVLENVVVYIANHIPIQEMIENKINDFKVDEAEDIILSVVNRELNMITVLGGLLGFIIGLITVFIS